MIHKRWSSLGAAAGALLVSSVALASPQPERGMGLPRDVSLDGHRIDWLIQVTGVFTIILFVIMCIWMGWAALKHNQDHKAEYDHGSSAKQVRHAATLSAIIFFVVDGNLWVNSTIDVNQAFWNFEMAESKPNAVRIQVNAHQWAWDFRYAGTDGKFNTPDDIVTLNEMKVPVNTPIILNLAAADVIHSFYLPNFRTKQDAMPGMINRLWFQSTQTGHFDIGCAQHCGTNHYKMKGMLDVVSEEEFKRWVTESSANAVKGFDPNDKDAQWGWEWRK
jgi:cytochrome c oxidase subunit 2